MSVSVARVRDSPFRESEWDRRLDDMLEDLGTGGGATTTTSSQQFASSQQTSYSSQQGVRTQFASQGSQQVQRSVGGGPPQILHQQHQQHQGQQQHLLQQQQQPTGNFALMRGPSGADLADGVLRDLEDGLEKSTRYIQDQQGDNTGGFNLEQQVQHMIPQNLQQRQQTSSSQQSSSSQQRSVTSSQQSYSQTSQQQQYNQVYKVQSNQYSGAGERIAGEEEERPASRLKQNIDELDTLLYDLNNARNLSPETTGQPSGLDSDDYDETVGTTGHVKRTVSAFNEYTQQTGKPPSPSPRRKESPSLVRKTPPTSPTRMNTRTNTSSSYQQQSTSSQQNYSGNSASYHRQEERAASPYQPMVGPPGSYQPFSYTDTEPHHSPSPHPEPHRSPEPPSVPFPSSSARPPTPQMPPKRVEELMSEFHEFDSSHGGSVSPVPAPFCRPAPRQHVTVTELEDEPPRAAPAPRRPSPPRAPAAPGPEIYYPPGADFHRPAAVIATQEVRPVADGGTLALERKRGRDARREERRREEGGDKQGAAVIPICLPLCCAAPCVIM